MTTLFFFFFIGQKQWREKREEKEKVDHVSMKEKIVQKVVTNSCTNIISLLLYEFVYPVQYCIC